VVDPLGQTTSFGYDALDRLTSITSPGPKTVGYRYDLDGNRTKVIYPDGTAVTYSFDAASRLASLTDWASRTVSYDYFTDGNLKLVTNPNGTTATYAYLGNGTTTDSSTPLYVANLSDLASIGAGGEHSLATKAADGTAWAWGLHRLVATRGSCTEYRGCPVDLPRRARGNPSAALV
jgi:YD repeat-containing protein